MTGLRIDHRYAPRVFTIPASAPFLPTLIEALIGGKLGFRVAAIRWRWPRPRFICRRAAPAGWRAMLFSTFSKTMRRSCRASSRIGDIDEDEIAFAEAATGDIAADALALPQALGGLERRLLLTQLISKWANSPKLHGASGTPLVAQTPAAACALADDLARLIDDMTTRGVAWDGSTTLCPIYLDRLLAAHAAVPADRARQLAGDSARARIDRAGGAARCADQSRSRAACASRPKRR